MLNTETSRALHRPAGGSLGQSDFNDSESQPFKQPASWGCHNILAWATSHLPPAEVEKRIGLILPPTLVLMDDWEPLWRARGVRVLDAWMGNIDPVLMRRMGIDKLLRSSIIHTMGLHASPPLTGVLKAAVRLINLTTAGKEKADAMAEVVDKGVIQGWTYAPSGIEGRRVLMSVAEDLELLCRELGVGIVRWLKVRTRSESKLRADNNSALARSAAVHPDSPRSASLQGKSHRSSLRLANYPEHR